jgi:lipoate-protein ligase A
MAFFASALRYAKPKLSWLNLRGTYLSALERLCLEEALLRHDPQERSWAIVGIHEPTSHRILRNLPTPPHVSESQQDANASCVIVMGIGGKAEKLLNVELVKKDGVQVLKRFSGGGTVVLDHSSLWTTFIGRTKDLVDVEAFPRPIMKWSADRIFGPAFGRLKQQSLDAPSSNKRQQQPKRSTMVVDAKSCSATENSGRVHEISTAHQGQPLDIPEFALVETDYVLGERKIGGNAQSIVKGGWLHHTSFLWDYEDEHMEYLSLPSKRPKYRGDRSHHDFLIKLKSYHGHLTPQTFFDHVKDSCSEEFQIEQITFREALDVVNDQVGGMQHWFETKCRTKIVFI